MTAAAIPATFLSAHHTGFLLIVLAVLVALAARKEIQKASHVGNADGGA